MNGQKGFTLSELTIGLGVFSILVLIASVLSSWAIYRYYSVRDRLLAEQVAYKGEVLFRNIYGQAVDVTFLNGTVPANLPSNTGRIFHNRVDGSKRFFRFDRMSASTNWTRISSFYREQATGGRGQLMNTAVFYREPTVDTSGVIFFDINSPSTNRGNLTPDYEGAFIERVTSFEMTKYGSPVADKTTSVEVMFRVRYHMFSGGRRSWCPQADIQLGTGQCANIQTGFRDLERRFLVVLSNNLIKVGGSYENSAVRSEERTMGGLYFFRTVFPVRYQ